MGGAVARCLWECLWMCGTLKLHQDLTERSQIQSQGLCNPFVLAVEDILAELNMHL